MSELNLNLKLLLELYDDAVHNKNWLGSVDVFVNNLNLGFEIFIDPTEHIVHSRITDQQKFILAKLKYGL
jgi:hypothetical protein